MTISPELLHTLGLLALIIAPQVFMWAMARIMEKQHRKWEKEN